MLIAFRKPDRMFGLKAIGVYRKGIEAASTACAKVYADTMALQTADGDASSASDWIAENLEDMGIGEEKDIEIPGFLALSLRTATSCYLAQLTKLVEKQADLLVPPDETNEVISHLQSLADRLNGQLEMRGTIGRSEVEITYEGRTTKTTINGMQRAVDHLAH